MAYRHQAYLDFRTAVVNGSYKDLIKDKKYVADNWECLAEVGVAHGLNDVILALRDVEVGSHGRGLDILAIYLYMACANGHLETVRLIYKISKDKVYQDRPNPHVKNAIYTAVRIQHLEILKEFVDEILTLSVDDIDFTVRDMVYKNFVKGLEFTRSIGVDVSDEKYVFLAVSLGHVETLRFLVEKCGIKISNKVMNEIVSSVVYHGDYDMTFFLINHGMSLDSYNGEYAKRLQDVKKYCDIRTRSEKKLYRRRVNMVYYKWIQLIYTPGSESAKRLAEASYNATMRGIVL